MVAWLRTVWVGLSVAVAVAGALVHRDALPTGGGVCEREREERERESEK